VDEATGKTIAKNTFWLFGGQITGRLLRAAIVIYAARVLGAASWGAFSYALSLAAFLTIFSDFGINGLLTREGVKSPELRNKYLATALVIKILLLLALIIGVLLLANNLTNLEGAAVLLPIIAFVFAFDSLRDLGTAMARALEKMHIEAWVNIFTNLTITVLGFVFLNSSKTASSLAWAYAIGTGLGFLAIVYILREYFRGFAKNFDKNLVKTIITSAWPFGLLGLMGVVMINTDILMLGWLTSAEETGFYSAAQKPIQLLYVLPMLIAAAFFPALTRLAKQESEGFRNVFERGLTTIYLMAAPLAVGGVILSKHIVLLLYGQPYLPAVSSFAILAATILVVFPATLIANGIFAHDKQKNLLGYVALGVFGNVFFNFLFIPLWGMEGAALSTFINQIIINIYLWRQFKRTRNFSILPHLKKIFLAAAIMGAVTLGLQYYNTNVLLNVLISGALYITILTLLKEPTIRLFKSLIH